MDEEYNNTQKVLIALLREAYADPVIYGYNQQYIKALEDVCDYNNIDLDDFVSF